MRSSGLPSLWDTCLFVSISTDKIDSSASANGCLPHFLKFSAEGENAYTCICHHFMSCENECIALHVLKRNTPMYTHLYSVDKEEPVSDNITHFFKRVARSRHVARILQTHDFYCLIHHRTKTLQINRVLLIESYKSYINVHSFRKHLPRYYICMML